MNYLFTSYPKTKAKNDSEKAVTDWPFFEQSVYSYGGPYE